MNSQKISFAFIVSVLASLACSLPGSNNPQATLPPPTAEAPVTFVVVVENTATIAVTETPSPTATPALPPEITLTQNSNCRSGPSSFYNIIDQISSGKTFGVIGRSEDNNWWQIVNATNRECWIFYENAQPNTDFGAVEVKSGPTLPGIPGQFFVTGQECQSGLKKLAVSFSWTSGADTDGFRLYRDGGRIVELKATKFNYKDTNAPYNKNIVYELEAFNENGTSEKVTQIVPACK